MSAQAFPDVEGPLEDPRGEDPPGKRPTGLTVVAVLSWSTAALVLLACAPAEVITPFLSGVFGLTAEQNPAGVAYEAAPWTRFFFVFLGLSAVPIYILLVVGAIGLWNGKRRGWLLCNLFAILEMARAVARAAVYFTVMMPLVREAYAEQMGTSAGAVMGIVGGVFQLVTYGFLPLLILVIINRGASARAREETSKVKGP